jgi:hypothetical protein
MKKGGYSPMTAAIVAGPDQHQFWCMQSNLARFLLAFGAVLKFGSKLHQ